MLKKLVLFPVCWIITIFIFAIHVNASSGITTEITDRSGCPSGIITTQDHYERCEFSIRMENSNDQSVVVLFSFKTTWVSPSYVSNSDVYSIDGKEGSYPKKPSESEFHTETIQYPIETAEYSIDDPFGDEYIVHGCIYMNPDIAGTECSEDVIVTIPSQGAIVINLRMYYPVDGGGHSKIGQCESRYGVFEGSYDGINFGTTKYCWQQKISIIFHDEQDSELTDLAKHLLVVKDNHNGPRSVSHWPSATLDAQTDTQPKGNDNAGTSTDSSQRQEDVGKPTQTTPPANDSDKIAALQQNIVDLQADVVSLNELVDKLLKENAALRHDNAVLSTLIDANQSNIIVVDEVVSEEATEVSQGTTETVSTPQVETSVTVTVDISGYEFVDIAPDGRPRIISTVDVQIHPDTRKRFLSEWGKFYDEHRDIEWWDCAGWTLYESPPVAVPVSEINANPHDHCDLRKP